uniref:Uncharacterized protein n=2 Tax=Scylla TaxID=6760 RepID=A0A0P4VU06_SCYOL
MTALDAHVRERLCSIRQQQEDLATLLSQMVAVVVDGERAVQHDDGRLIMAFRDLSARMAHVTSQEQQLAQLLALAPDPAIPITFTKDNRIHIGARIEMRVVTLGLDGAGKTSILFKLKQDEFVSTIPTIGFNVETIEYKNFKFTVWDVGGQLKLRPLWRHYYFNTQAVIFVVDATDVERLPEAQTELTKLMTERELKDASLLIFANKENSEHALGMPALTDSLGLHKLCLGRSWHIQPCDAQSGTGLHQGLDWLARQLVPSEVLNSAG